MPELPDILAYITALEPRVIGERLKRLRIASPFVVRTASPAPAELDGKTVIGLRRLGKRIVLVFEDDLFVVVHLMIAGRFQWKAAGAKLPGKLALACFDFDTGSLVLTEASTRKRASISVLRGDAALHDQDRGGLAVMEASPEAFEATLRRENHTLKRALTDPTLFSGVGNAYSDEILHRARLSPFALTSRLSAEEARRLYDATRDTLGEWIERLCGEARECFPKKVTAFRDEMAVHGKYGKPCPVCAAPVQRIVYAENEANYCAVCQTGGKLLADRALSRLLKSDWPRTLEEMEEHRQARRS